MAKKILIADDEEMIREAIKIGLKNEGYELYEAKDGLEALYMAQTIKPDMIILDVMMPGKVGYQVCKELRENPESKDTYIMFLTARGEHARDAVPDVGGDELLAKPFDIKELRQKVKNALEMDDRPLLLDEKNFSMRPEIGSGSAKDKIQAGKSKITKKILIAEDDEDIRAAVRILLTTDECEVYETGDGREALKMAREIKPDLVILDIMMPGRVGYTVCKELKDDPKTKDIYIIFITARETADARKTIDTYGGDAFFKKPFDIDELRDTVREMLGI
jgi:DNA-binding response OmpR family regulator